jgi:hypothetical protein
MIAIILIALSASFAIAAEKPSTAKKTQKKNTLTAAEKKEGFKLMFDGKSMKGWKLNENPKSAQVKDGNLVTHGKRAHLYYVGDGKDNQFTNLELRAKVKIHPSSNSGIYVHVKWHDNGWPIAQGYEAQVCSNDYRDPKKTGSIYNFKNLGKSAVPDGEWFDYKVTVKGRTITTTLNGKVAATYTEPKDKPTRLKGGYIALQCHDPKSTVEYHTLRVKKLTASK